MSPILTYHLEINPFLNKRCISCHFFQGSLWCNHLTEICSYCLLYCTSYRSIDSSSSLLMPKLAPYYPHGWTLEQHVTLSKIQGKPFSIVGCIWNRLNLWGPPMVQCWIEDKGGGEARINTLSLEYQWPYCYFLQNLYFNIL